MSRGPSSRPRASSNREPAAQARTMTTGARSLSRSDLTAMVEAGIVDAAQAERIWAHLDAREAIDPRPRFDLMHLLWYAGALIVIAAMGLFTNEAWSRFGGVALTV